MSESFLLDGMLLLLVIVPIFPAVASVILVRHWHTDSPSLRERTVLAIRDWLVASIAAFLALARFDILEPPDGWALPLLAISLLLVGLPSVYWLWLFWSGHFHGEIRPRTDD